MTKPAFELVLFGSYMPLTFFERVSNYSFGVLCLFLSNSKGLREKRERKRKRNSTK